MRLTWHRQFCQQTTMDSKCQQQQLILNIFGIQGSWKYCPPEKTGAMKKGGSEFSTITIHSGLEMSRATRKHLWHPKQLEALPTREKGGNEIEIAKKKTIYSGIKVSFRSFQGSWKCCQPRLFWRDMGRQQSAINNVANRKGRFFC